MAHNKRDGVGRTKKTGCQIGVRRKDIPLEEAWKRITAQDGLKRWLGVEQKLDMAQGEQYVAQNGVKGEVRVSKRHSHIRVTWWPPGGPRASTNQVRVIPKCEKSVIAFHQEHLPGPEEREQGRVFFTKVLEEWKEDFSSWLSRCAEWVYGSPWSHPTKSDPLQWDTPPRPSLDGNLPSPARSGRIRFLPRSSTRALSPLCISI